MMRLVLAGGIVLAPLCATARGVIECKAELPVARTGYWSWRNIDGKQCWYPGRPGMDKARLQWPRSTHLPDPNESESDRLKVAVGASVLTRTGLRLFGICDCLSFPKNPSRLNRRVGPDDDRGIAILELLDRSLRGSPARRSALDPTTPNSPSPLGNRHFAAPRPMPSWRRAPDKGGPLPNGDKVAAVER